MHPYFGEKDWLHIARVEELYPFPAKHIKAIFSKLPNLEEIVWVQEEPQNMGAWNYIEPYLREVAPKDVKVRYDTALQPVQCAANPFHLPFY